MKNHLTIKPLLAVLLALSLVLPSFGTLAANEDRYELTQTALGFVRLDKQTGAVSQCKMEGENLTCRLSADERIAFEKEISRLIAENETLRSQLKTDNGKPNGLPSEEEIDETISMFETFAAAIFKAMKRVQKDMDELSEEETSEAQ